MDRWYTKKDIAALADVSEKTVENWIESGKLPQSVGPWSNPKRYPADEVDKALGLGEETL